MDDIHAIPFTMNYYALKTFGRQQYSNPWAALSELIANGFDAEAESVYLFIDMRNKEHAVIEIIDNGYGMDPGDLEKKYVVIGRNRRIDNPNDTSAGRKGIGKLAALYLSDVYEIVSSKQGKLSAWSVDVRDKTDDDIPSLFQIDQTKLTYCCSPVWDKLKGDHGTMIRLPDVNLCRIGERSIAGLRRKLSDYFLFEAQSRFLYFALVDSEEKYRDFCKKGIEYFDLVEKQVAFDNMSHIMYSPSSHINCTKETYKIPFKNTLDEDRVVELSRETIPFPETVYDKESNSRVPLNGCIEINGIEKEYSLRGCIGIHSSIESSTAKNNDSRFIRNNIYTPNRLRIYIRNKLANDSFLSRLNLVGTYANYLEGELSFDVLDENDLEDITTANRQDFSVDDDRIVILRRISRGLCRQLISLRQQVADKVNEIKNSEDNRILSAKKTHFASETHADLLSAGISKGKADELSLVISNKLKGEYSLKSSYKIFISHSSKDRIFTDFIVKYLCHKGATWDRDADKTEIFYSSDGTDITTTIPLADIIKRMIIDSNTDILFFTSKNSKASQYCLFEGGAAWATRAVEGYSIISLDYSSIPDYLTNGKPEFTFSTEDRNSFILNEQNYTNLIIILNRLISHLNKNRIGKEMPLIPDPHFDDKVQMKAKGLVLADYMDSEICEYWNTYVIEKIDQYLLQ